MSKTSLKAVISEFRSRPDVLVSNTFVLLEKSFKQRTEEKISNLILEDKASNITEVARKLGIAKKKVKRILKESEKISLE